MPISPLTLQRRFAELGRIRLGAKKDGRGRPMKLAAFRFTSPTQRYITDLAELYGGQPRPWDNNGKPEYEVFTDATSIPVVAMKGGMTQWMETWSGGGIAHRCDGETNALTGEACDPNDPAHRDAKPTTRLSLMLTELDAIGAFRMESKGWNAAAEIPAVAELAQFVGDLVPAHLTMVERRIVKNGQTSRFVVPVLDLQIGAARLREVVAAKSGAPLELAAGGEQPAGEQRAALPASSPAEAEQQPADPWEQARAALAEADSLPRLAQIWDVAVQQGLVGQRSAETPERDAWIADWKAKAHAIKAAMDQESSTSTAAAQQPNPDGTYDADVVEDAAPAGASTATTGDADAVWQRLLAAAGERGMSTPDLEHDFAERMGGLTTATASAEELQHYLDTHLTTGAAA